MKTLFLMLLLVSVNASASNTYCNSFGPGTTVCNTYRDDGSTKSDYWTSTGSGSSYKNTEFDSRSNGDSDE